MASALPAATFINESESQASSSAHHNVQQQLPDEYFVTSNCDAVTEEEAERYTTLQSPPCLTNLSEQQPIFAEKSAKQSLPERSTYYQYSHHQNSSAQPSLNFHSQHTIHIKQEVSIQPKHAQPFRGSQQAMYGSQGEEFRQVSEPSSVQMNPTSYSGAPPCYFPYSDPGSNAACRGYSETPATQQVLFQDEKHRLTTPVRIKG